MGQLFRRHHIAPCWQASHQKNRWKFQKNIRKKYPSLPVVILTYSNILQRVGFEYFMKKSKECGVDGFILPDMAIEESDEYVMEASQLDLAAHSSSISQYDP